MNISDKLSANLMSVLSLARSSLRSCPAATHLIDNGFDSTHHADITIRANGKDYHCEADWARHALRLLRSIAIENGITELPVWQDSRSPPTPLNCPLRSPGEDV